MNLFDVTGKKAIVTGAAQGLAYGMAEGLMEAGVEVAIIDISAKTADVAAEFVKKGYKCHAVNANLGNKADLKRGFDEALEKLGGRLDIIINAAGIQKRHFSEEFPVEDWEEVINVNLNSVFFLCQLAGRQMLKQGSGKIINIASMLSFFGGYTVPAYAASKGGVAQLTKALSNEWASKGVNVNAIAPGYMDTEMNVNLVNDPNRNAEILGRIPAKRWGTPNDMKGVALFLSAPASDYLNGAIIPVDGGYLGR
ncbi:MAG: 2-dehydro-3-deoxy-D-gluconate 5-dehydrogenase [Petroclostridium sp.]|jgi:2-deoxy-D-gluconate 3-dehydrogenase|uniref:SDR family oxidoreductase n=1 Tax=Petroclostridium xylanilyticum TaxID=1792311 RepID=UPI000B99A6A1|nr:SDR family oxidoreductase [Petroclostridium xylanilyticum]MBZ4646868.1 putative dehydrogenase like protein [Clostridia bacterium]MDK2811627.1 2-dehydro-3-deoxy-D-gluconate 5-dehydrogenase [Petroclostridium sp.]